MCNRTVQQMMASQVSDWMSSTFLMAYGDATLDAHLLCPADVMLQDKLRGVSILFFCYEAAFLPRC